ncbi:MAG TPA: hypothetical protein VEY95_07040 [Azospirillaceae bacterium]|nr:hypothetical protein [Azospirillaceae bacterium]
MMRISVIAAGLLLIGTAACENLSDQQNRALVGGGIGATGGAAVGHVTGLGAGTGAVLGGGAGAATGALTQRGDVPGERAVRRRLGN